MVHFLHLFLHIKDNQYFFEIMREMKDSSEFTFAVTFANSLMFVVYFVTTTVAYYYRGAGVNGFLPFSLPDTYLKTIVGLLLSFHIIVSYLISAQPLTFRIHEFLFPLTVHKFDFKSKVHWFIITCMILMFSYVVANLIPFFSDFQNIIGSSLGAPVVFGWPAYFYLKGAKNNNYNIPRNEKLMCYLFLFVFLPLCTILGFISAVKNLVHDWKTFGLPFSCHLVGY